jgi:Zn-dependent alcohol dehydrogenase
LDVVALVSHHLALEEVNRGFAMMKSGESVRWVVIYQGDCDG